MTKNSGRFMSTLFCDDIRQEIGNKISLMGCYQSELFVPHIPTVLPKFGVYVSVWTPIDHPFKNLSVRVLQDDETELASVTMPEEDIHAASQKKPPDSEFRGVHTFIAFAPFVVERPTQLRANVITEEGEIRGQKLRVALQTPEQPEPVGPHEPRRIAAPPIKSAKKVRRTDPEKREPRRRQ